MDGLEEARLPAGQGVLIVDDDPPQRLLLSSHVWNEGYRPIEADGPEQALAILESTPGVRLVLTDVRMPDRADGIGFIRAVRQRWPELPVAAILTEPADLSELHNTPDWPVLILPKPVRARQIKEALRLALHGFINLYEAMACGITVYDAHGELVYISREGEKLIGLVGPQITGRQAVPPDWKSTDDQGADAVPLSRLVLESGRPIRGVTRCVSQAGGQRRWIYGDGVPVTGPGGNLEHIVCSFVDITERRLVEQRYRTIVETANEGISTVDTSGRFTFLNQRLCAMLQCTEEEMIGRPFLDIIVPEEVPAVRQDLSRYARTDFSGERPFRRKDGSLMWVMVSASPLFEGDAIVGRLAMLTDVTERRQAQERLLHQELHDALTGLPNRTLLHDRLRQALLLARRDGASLGLLLMDVDRFKEVNDSFGHEQGDRLLCEIAGRLQRVFRESDTIARLGGDEFALILPGCAGADQVRRAALKVLDALDQPVLIAGQSLIIEASIGGVLCPEHGDDGPTLLRRADMAMYAAKRNQGGYHLFQIGEDDASSDQLSLTSELRLAIERQELVLRYQPKVGFREAAVGVEALVRWQHPRLGLLSPDKFVPLAEQTGAIKQLTQWVLDEACRQCRLWHDAGLTINVGVNLSMRNLSDPTLVDFVRDTLRRHHVDPAWIVLELTETAVMADASYKRDLIRLHDMGLKLSIDDFGTGYSSLAYLKQLPVAEIKIDQSFVGGMATDENDAVIVRSTIDLGHNLGLRVVAEGIEDQLVWGLLAGLGCDAGQGFYMGRPMAGGDIERWLDESPFGRARSRCAVA